MYMGGIEYVVMLAPDRSGDNFLPTKRSSARRSRMGWSSERFKIRLSAFPDAAGTEAGKRKAGRLPESQMPHVRFFFFALDCFLDDF